MNNLTIYIIPVDTMACWQYLADKLCLITKMRTQPARKPWFLTQHSKN